MNNATLIKSIRSKNTLLLYRNLLKAAFALPRWEDVEQASSMQHAAVAQIKTAFKNNKSNTDDMEVAKLLERGQKELNFMNKLLGDDLRKTVCKNSANFLVCYNSRLLASINYCVNRKHD